MIAHSLCQDRIEFEVTAHIRTARRFAGEWGDGERPAEITMRFAKQQATALAWEQEALDKVVGLSEEQAYAALPMIRLGIDVDSLVA